MVSPRRWLAPLLGGLVVAAAVWTLAPYRPRWVLRVDSEDTEFVMMPDRQVLVQTAVPGAEELTLVDLESGRASLLVGPGLIRFEPRMFSADGRRIACVAGDKVVVLETPGGKRQELVLHDAAAAQSLAGFHGDRLVYHTSEGGAALRDAETGREIAWPLAGPNTRVRERDRFGKLIVEHEGVLKVWCVDAGKVLAEYGANARNSYSMTLTPDGRHLTAMFPWQDNLSLYSANPESGKTRLGVSGHDPFALAPDGQIVAAPVRRPPTGGWDWAAWAAWLKSLHRAESALAFVRVADEVELATIDGAQRAAFAPDGSAVVLLFRDGTLGAYDWPLAAPWSAPPWERLALAFGAGLALVWAGRAAFGWWRRRTARRAGELPVR